MSQKRRYHILTTDRDLTHLVSSDLLDWHTTFEPSQYTSQAVTLTGNLADYALNLFRENEEVNTVVLIRTTTGRVTTVFVRQDDNVLWYARQWTLPRKASNLRKAKQTLIGSLGYTLLDTLPL